MPATGEDYDKSNTERFDSFRIAAHVLAVRIGEGGEQFDRVAYLQHSGGMLLSLVGEDLGFSPHDALPMPITRHPDWPDNVTQEFQEGICMPPKRAVRDTKVLLLGNVWRSGGLLRYTAERLEELGAKAVRTGVAYLRDDHLRDGGPLPNYFGFPAGKNIIFQWITPPEGYGEVKPIRR